MDFKDFLTEGTVTSISSKRDEREGQRRRTGEWNTQVAELFEPVYDAVADAVTAVRELNAEYLDIAQGQNASELIYQRLKHLTDNFPY